MKPLSACDYVPAHNAWLRRSAAGWILVGVCTLPSWAVESDSVAPSHDGALQSEFDGKRAMQFLRILCQIGPRPSGSKGMQRQQELLRRYFERLGFQATRQEFKTPHPRTGAPVEMANLIVPLHPETTRRVVLCAHYDTRPYPDRDPDPRHRRGRFVGANDGASGVAVLGELARHLKNWDREFGVDLVFFDAEEFVFQKGDAYFYGSEYFARQYVADPPAHTYRWGILLDMVGDADLQIYQEINSLGWPDTRPLVHDVWATAKRLGVTEFIAKPGYDVQDDHLALRNIAGIPTCDIIDFSYPNTRNPISYWHSRQDTSDKCSADSLQKVGRVVLEWLRTVHVDGA